MRFLLLSSKNVFVMRIIVSIVVCIILYSVTLNVTNLQVIFHDVAMNWNPVSSRKYLIEGIVVWKFLTLIDSRTTGRITSLSIKPNIVHGTVILPPISWKGWLLVHADAVISLPLKPAAGASYLPAQPRERVEPFKHS